MTTEHSFGLKEKKESPNFFEDNLDKDVNLYGTSPATTYSGVLTHYSHQRQTVTLNPYIGMVYDNKGSMQYQELHTNFEIPTEIVGAREITTREDRLGRITKYNRDLDKSKQKPK